MEFQESTEPKRASFFGNRRDRVFSSSSICLGESKSEGFKENSRARSDSLERKLDRRFSSSSSSSSSSDDSNENLDQISPLLLRQQKNHNRASLPSRLSFSKNPLRLRKIEEGIKRSTSQIRDARANRAKLKRESWRFGIFEKSPKRDQNDKRLKPRPFTVRSNLQRRDPATPDRVTKSFTFPRNDFSPPSRFRAHSYDLTDSDEQPRKNSFGSLYQKRQAKEEAFLKASARRKEIDSILDNARQMRKAEDAKRNDKRMSFKLAIHSKSDSNEGVKGLGRKGSMEDLKLTRDTQPLPKTNSFHSLTPRARSHSEKVSFPWQKANTWRTNFVERPASNGELLRTRYEVDEADGKTDLSDENSAENELPEDNRKVSVEEFTDTNGDGFAEHTIFE